MAMVVQHNIAAQMALGELNKNSDRLRKSLEKVSNGQKINSAKDDASSYVISEKMREMVRTLNQDHQNVQNGSSLFKIADGGVNSIVEELRNLKELAINAANDTNTDHDRATIQKDFTQKMANINDIATTTNYNGKALLDGTYGKYKVDGPAVGAGEVLCPDMTKDFTPLTGTTESGTKMSGSGHAVTSSYKSTGNAQVYVDFSHISDGISSLNGKGFSIFCGGCDQYINIIFDATTSGSTYNGDLESFISEEAREYRIGIGSVLLQWMICLSFCLRVSRMRK